MKWYQDMLRYICIKITYPLRILEYVFKHIFQSDIVDVNTIFTDLATMVHEQGEMVDSIEGNVENTAISVHDGTDQLRQAEIYKVSNAQILIHYNARKFYLFFFR